MSLKGSLKIFNLTNILQMISMEKKTGILEVSRDSKTISISFLGGKVVSAEMGIKKDELRIKQSFIKNNYINENDWNRAYAERQQSLKPLLQVLKRYVKADVLSSFANKQIKDGVFELLRWEEGEYEFTPQKINFDTELVSPLDVEFLLMEGCRVADERTELEKSLPKANEPIQKNIFDYNKSYFTDLDNTNKAKLELEILKKKGMKLDENEKKIFLAMDDYTSIENIINSSMLEEFETCQIITKFLSLNIIKPCKRKRIKKTRKKSEKGFTLYKSLDRFLKAALLSILLILNLCGIYNLSQNFFTDMKYREKNIDIIRKMSAMAELNIILNSVNEYRVLKGSYPVSIKEIVMNGLLENRYIYDPWLRKYNYSFNKKNNSFSISSSGKDERDEHDDIVVDKGGSLK